MKVQQQRQPIKLGYFALRGRAQVARLLLEYLRMPYENILFSSKQQWAKYKADNQEKYPLLDLPFIIDGDLVISEAVPVCCYIINKSKKVDLIGRNLRDISIVNMYSWSLDSLGMSLVKLCWMPGKPEKVEEVKARFWQLNVRDKIERLDRFVAQKPWLLGYMSLVDFSIYELIHYITIIFPKQIQDYKKLLQIERKIGCLPEIKGYEKSQKAIKTFLPPSMFIRQQNKK